MAGTWDKYEAAYAAIKGDMLTFMTLVAAPFGVEVDEDTMVEDYGFRFALGKRDIGVELQLWDSHEASGDFEAGERGNLHLSATYNGGQIIISFAPKNYTKECWVDYADVAEFKARLAEMMCEIDSVVAALREARAKGAGS